jgi:hypothetical protein
VKQLDVVVDDRLVGVTLVVDAVDVKVDRVVVPVVLVRVDSVAVVVEDMVSVRVVQNPHDSSHMPASVPGQPGQ